MNINNEDAISRVYDIIEVNKLCDKGYKEAAEQMQNEELKTILYRLSQQRALFAAELQNEIRDIGGHFDKDTSSIGSKLYQTLMNFKGNLSGNNTIKILEDCKDMEHHAMKEYEKALKDEIPLYIKKHLEEQYNLIKGAIIQLNEFEHNP